MELNCKVETVKGKKGTFEFPLSPSKWLNQIQKNGTTKNVNERKGFKCHCLDISYPRMWLVHIVAPGKMKVVKLT